MFSARSRGAAQRRLNTTTRCCERVARADRLDGDLRTSAALLLRARFHGGPPFFFFAPGAAAPRRPSPGLAGGRGGVDAPLLLGRRCLHGRRPRRRRRRSRRSFPPARPRLSRGAGAGAGPNGRRRGRGGAAGAGAAARGRGARLLWRRPAFFSSVPPASPHFGAPTTIWRAQRQRDSSANKASCAEKTSEVVRPPSSLHLHRRIEIPKSCDLHRRRLSTSSASPLNSRPPSRRAQLKLR